MCPKKCSERGKTKYLDFFFIEASATKCWEKSRMFRYGCLMIFWVKGKKPRGGVTVLASGKEPNTFGGHYLTVVYGLKPSPNLGYKPLLDHSKLGL